jgi:hypothetical protein
MKVAYYQVKPMFVAVVTKAAFAKFTGASGLVIKIAPFPASDVTELPTTLIAVTVAHTGLKGSDRNVAAVSGW